MIMRWYPCPKCGYGKLLKIREDTIIRNALFYCKRCKQENLINIEPEPRARAN